MMKVGKLYKCSKYWLLFYPTEETARAAQRSTVQAASASGTAPPQDRAAAAGAVAPWPGALVAETEAAYWSKRLNCKVGYGKPEEVFMVLKQKDEFAHVLFGEKQGWIINKNWLEIKRIK